MFLIVSMGQSGDVVYQNFNIGFFDIIASSGWFGIIILLSAFTCIIITTIHFIEDARWEYSKNPVVRWCYFLDGTALCFISIFLACFGLLVLSYNAHSLANEVVEKNITQKYSFDNMKVNDIDYGNVDTARATLYDYSTQEEFEVKVWIDPVTHEPTIKSNELVSDKYLNGFAK